MAKYEFFNQKRVIVELEMSCKYTYLLSKIGY